MPLHLLPGSEVQLSTTPMRSSRCRVVLLCEGCARRLWFPLRGEAAGVLSELSFSELCDPVCLHIDRPCGARWFVLYVISSLPLSLVDGCLRRRRAIFSKSVSLLSTLQSCVG